MTEEKEHRKTGAPVPMGDCGMALAAQLLGDRWSLLIIRECFYGVRRFGVIRNDLGIPRAALSDRLDRLVSNGILKKAPYRETGRREHYEYILTQKGQGLLPSLISLMQWGDKYLKNNAAPAVKFVNASTGSCLRAAVIDEQGAEIRHLKDIKMVIRQA